MQNRKINKIAIIGSGIMGSGIACHFANIGVEVLLLDIIPGGFKIVRHLLLIKNGFLEFKRVLHPNAIVP